MTPPAMTCPKCGTPMNYQASKLVQPVTAEESARQAEELDGLLVLVFACPGCGWVDARREGDEPTATA